MSKPPVTYPSLWYLSQVFTSTSTVAFKTFACDDEAVEGESYLRADYSLSCQTNSHILFRFYAAVMILVSRPATVVERVAMGIWHLCCFPDSLILDACGYWQFPLSCLI